MSLLCLSATLADKGVNLFENIITVFPSELVSFTPSATWVFPSHIHDNDPCHSTPNHDHTLLVPESGNHEWQLLPFVFLSSNHHHNRLPPQPSDFLPVVWKGKVKLPNECDQERVHLNDTMY